VFLLTCFFILSFLNNIQGLTVKFWGKAVTVKTIHTSELKTQAKTKAATPLRRLHVLPFKNYNQPNRNTKLNTQANSIFAAYLDPNSGSLQKQVGGLSAERSSKNEGGRSVLTQKTVNSMLKTVQPI
jgi:hypothetical protein